MTEEKPVTVTIQTKLSGKSFWFMGREVVVPRLPRPPVPSKEEARAEWRKRWS